MWLAVFAWTLVWVLLDQMYIFLFLGEWNLRKLYLGDCLSRLKGEAENFFLCYYFLINLPFMKMKLSWCRRNCPSHRVLLLFLLAHFMVSLNVQLATGSTAYHVHHILFYKDCYHMPCVYALGGGDVVKSISVLISLVQFNKPPWWPMHFTFTCDYIYLRKYCLDSVCSDNVARWCIMVPRVGSVHAVVRRFKLYTVLVPCSLCMSSTCDLCQGKGHRKTWGWVCLPRCLHAGQEVEESLQSREEACRKLSHFIGWVVLRQKPQIKIQQFLYLTFCRTPFPYESWENLQMKSFLTLAETRVSQWGVLDISVPLWHHQGLIYKMWKKS